MLTITIPFSGKLHCLDRVLFGLKTLQISRDKVRVILLDNSGNNTLNDRLLSFSTENHGWLSCELITKPKGYFQSVSDIYTFLVPLVKGDWLSLEDDVVEYPPDLLSRMRREILTYPDIGIVSAYMEARRGHPGPMAWMVELQNGEPGLRPTSPRPSGLSRVDATHMGCT